ncbi:MAG: hypothetical protein MJ116_02920 [Lachnospiraceae bacterium]|nr:hypothetical protein [Lachnospiraceae bacterium]
MAGTELAKAYVQIVPSAKGIAGSIKSALAPEASSAGVAAGESIASNLMGKLKAVIAAAGIGAAIKSSLDAGGAIQQSFGGLDTLYEGAEDKMKSYAQTAYKVGFSANEYAENATSFGAALKNAFGGDTVKAAESANQAITDIADNSSKFGTDMQSLTVAYQGFSKQNYTMLDNLKLGYGGTKKEMERLLADAEKLSGKKYNIDNLGDVYEAIHVIQNELGVAGNAAEEADKTFSGSFASMKAAATNLLASLSAEEMDVGPQMSALVETANNFFFNNLIPMLGRIAASIPEAVGTMITTAGPIISEKAKGLIDYVVQTFGNGGWQGMLEQGALMVSNFISGINENIPFMLSAGGEMLNNLVTGILNSIPTLTGTAFNMITQLARSIIQNMPVIVTTGLSVITNFVVGILQNLPTVMQQGYYAIMSLVNGIRKNFPQIVTAAANGIAQFCRGVASNLPQVLSTGLNILLKLIAGIISGIGRIPSAVGQIISSIRGAFSGIDWGSIGRNIISGIASGISGAVGSIVSAAKGAAQSALQAAKNLLGIHSPSRVFRDQVGYQIIAGWTEGITENRNKVLEAVTGIAEDSYKIPNRDISDFVTSDRYGSSRIANSRIVDLLEIIARKDPSLTIGNKEFKRILDDFGVAYA